MNKVTHSIILIVIFFISITNYANGFAAPSRRIISLAPNITELLFAAGAGQWIVGTSTYSDYPLAANKIPVVADYTGLDIENILALKPDLIIAWQGGNPEQQLEQLSHFGIPIYRVNIQTLPDIASTLIEFGKLAGTELIAQKAANQFMLQYQKLRAQNQRPHPVSVFYEMSQSPLLTSNKNSLVSQMIHDCGGINIFADTLGSAPEVNVASVLASQPQVILIGENKQAGSQAYQAWRAWPQLTAVSSHHVFILNPDWVSRAGPRALLGMQQICNALKNS